MGLAETVSYCYSYCYCYYCHCCYNGVSQSPLENEILWHKVRERKSVSLEEMDFVRPLGSFVEAPQPESWCAFQ